MDSYSFGQQLLKPWHNRPIELDFGSVYLLCIQMGLTVEP